MAETSNSRAAIDAAIAARWERIARADGWQEARDVDTGGLVVFHETRGIHYTGARAWVYAALDAS